MNDSKIADIFNQACYFQLQSNRLKSKPLQKHSSDLFNEAMRLRNSLPKEIKEKYLLVRDGQIKFITNGTYYYFSGQRFNDIDVLKYAESVVKNYFNKAREIDVKVLNGVSNPLEFLNMFMFHDEENIKLKNYKLIILYFVLVEYVLVVHHQNLLVNISLMSTLIL